mmetsp:Transcript_20102/g.37345  ORF Transcript_20102/g.37345 Transcript_20102/m.37345 type:complete len:318 (-) Transcript_20102:4393-5346(-)
MDRFLIERAHTTTFDKRQSAKVREVDISEVDTGYSSDNETKPKKPAMKFNDKLNQSTSAVIDTRGKRCCICFKKEGFFAKYAKCPVCSQLVCSDHNKHTIDNKAVCDACFNRVVVETRRNYRDENAEVLNKLKDELESLVIKRDELMTHRSKLSRKQAELDEKIQQRKKNYLEEEEVAQKRKFKEEARNESVQSQLATMMQAYEDAKHSELETSKRYTNHLALIDASRAEQSFIEQQREQLSIQLNKANFQMTKLLNPFKFFEIACRPCKAKFANQFRNELIRDRVDVDNLSFINVKASTAADPARREPDTCRCVLM